LADATPEKTKTKKIPLVTILANIFLYI